MSVGAADRDAAQGSTAAAELASIKKAAVTRAARPDLGALVELMRDFYAAASDPLDRSWAAGAFSPPPEWDNRTTERRALALRRTACVIPALCALVAYAHFGTSDMTTEVRAGQRIEVLPGVPHQFANESQSAVAFLVFSCPHSHGDRTNVQERT